MRFVYTTSRARGAAHARRGGAYLAVLGVTTVVTVIGLSAVAVTRLERRAIEGTNNLAEARGYADSAVNIALLKINQNTNWRATYTHDTWTAAQTIGNGTLQWKLVDQVDTNLNNNTTDPVRIVGQGTVGTTTQLCSVLLTSRNVPYDVLRTAMHSSGEFRKSTKTLTLIGGPASTNANLTRTGTIVGSAEAVTHSGSGSVSGTLTSPAPVKPMPPATVFDTYQAMATQITGLTPSGGAINLVAPLLSSTVNPFAGGTNTNGIYYIVLPASVSLEIKISRIQGTLVVFCNDNAEVHCRDPINWEPVRTDLPILLVKHTGSSPTEEWFAVDASSVVSESALGANLNPAGTPYNTVADADTTDVYPSEFRGLIHIIGPTNTITSIWKNTKIVGTMIADCPLFIVTDASAVYNPGIYSSPPEGYYQKQMIVSPGSWRRETLP